MEADSGVKVSGGPTRSQGRWEDCPASPDGMLGKGMQCLTGLLPNPPQTFRCTSTTVLTLFAPCFLATPVEILVGSFLQGKSQWPEELLVAGATQRSVSSPEHLVPKILLQH